MCLKEEALFSYIIDPHDNPHKRLEKTKERIINYQLLISSTLKPNTPDETPAFLFLAQRETQNQFFQVFWEYWMDVDLDGVVEPHDVVQDVLGRAAVAMGFGRNALDNLEDLIEEYMKDRTLRQIGGFV
ncbi:hypothetical protein OIDMADRAFT_36032 [Oidiodendron maius Zn]|uniref:Uncharacterized protein n=1 Tax=Oidiodendron maius (strain Zn) TaxID=913774 RepID=A0A0C3C2K5_OIDMZ|nr:hypothetical protein OIDMADRAFT_36032 [Oidiodendron maius Zn]